MNYEQERLWRGVVVVPAFLVALSLVVAERDCRQSDVQAGNQTHGLPNKRTGLIRTLRYELSRHTIRRRTFETTFFMRVYFILNLAIMMCSEAINESKRSNDSIVGVKASCKYLSGKIGLQNLLLYFAYITFWYQKKTYKYLLTLSEMYFPR